MGRGAQPTWSSYRDSIGDRSGLFAALRDAWHPTTALYPGSYLDLSPSTAIPAVTYVDVDRRAARFFADQDLVRTQLATRLNTGGDTGSVDADVRFLHQDYTTPLPLPEASFDLLISLYAGPVWEHCGLHLAPEGLLLANTSHGDASLAALDPTLRLVAAVHQRDGRYRLDSERLERYLVPKKPESNNVETIRISGRGVSYTVTAFAYVFTRGEG